MLEALYLDAAEQPVAVLAEGPALRLRRHGVADVFAPVPRLARVVVFGPRVQLRTEALLACLQGGVPVLFLVARGKLAGVLAPVVLPAWRRDLAALLEAEATEAGFRRRLEDFCRAEERRAAIETVRAERPSLAGGALADLRPAAWRAHWCGRSRQPAAAEWLLDELRGLAAAAVAEGLARGGVGPQFLARRTGGFPLPERLGAALALRLAPLAARRADTLTAPGTELEDARLRRVAIGLFESASLAPERDRMLSRLAWTLAGEPRL